MAVQEMRQQGLFGKTNRVNYESLNHEIEGGSNPLGGQKITVRFRCTCTKSGEKFGYGSREARNEIWVRTLRNTRQAQTIA